MLLRAINKFKKHLCPFCFDYFYLKHTPFRCSSPPSKCAPEPDTVYESKWRDSRAMGKVLNRYGKFMDRFSRSVSCDKCENKSYKRICPHCHMELPYTTGQYKNHIFAVIGTKDSGKSHYISVLINQIKKRIGPNMGLLLAAENDFTITRYSEHFYRPVFEEGKTIAPTASATVEESVRIPMIFSIRLTTKNIFKKSKIKKYMTLVFFDTAGEDLNKEDTMSTVNKYIYRSDGLILLIDPLQLHTVRNLLPTGTPLPKTSAETHDILNNTTRLITKGQNLDTKDVIKIPLAIAFSKFDAVLPLVDSQYQLHSSANHNNGFDIEDFEAINSEMLSLLDRWNGQDIIHLAQTCYKTTAFFGLSSLGCNPHDTSKISSVQPRRVEDPFLWLLAHNKIIKKIKH